MNEDDFYKLSAWLLASGIFLIILLELSSLWVPCGYLASAVAGAMALE